MGLTSDMATQIHVLARRGTFYYRRKIPVDLQRHYGKVEIKHSLGTKDRPEAERLARRRSVELDQEFEALRSSVANKSPETPSVIDESLIVSICEAWRHCALDGDDWYRQQGLSDTEFDQLTTDRQATDTALRHLLARGQVEKIRPALDQLLRLLGLNVSCDTPNYQQLAYRFLQSLVETSAATLQRSEGLVVKTPPAPPLTDGITAPAPPSRTTAPTLTDLCKAWETDVPDRPRETVQAFESVVREFNAHIGVKAAAQLTRGDFIAFRDHLTNPDGSNYNTVEKKIRFLNAIMQLAVDDQKLPANPCARLRIPKPKRRPPPRVPYEPEDMNGIYRGPVYAQGERPVAGGGAAAVWLPLLSPLSGCRLEELGQLRTFDVKCEGGIWYLDIVQEDDEFPTRLKNRASVRRLPIHDTLIDLGFLRYAQTMQAKGRGRLFPDLTPDHKGKFTGNFGKWWGRYAREAPIGITSSLKTFHSFRHTFRDACREAGLDEELADALMGHAGNSTGRSYGKSFSLMRLVEVINRIEYPDVDFPVLRE